MDENKHIPKYAAGGEMDRLDRPKRSYQPNRPPPWLLACVTLILVLLLTSKQDNGALSGCVQFKPLTSSSPLHSDTFEYRDVVSNYDPETGDIKISGYIRARNCISYYTTVTLECFVGETILFTDTQNLNTVSCYHDTAFAFVFNLGEQCRLQNVPQDSSFSYKIKSTGLVSF